MSFYLLESIVALVFGTVVTVMAVIDGAGLDTIVVGALLIVVSIIGVIINWKK